LDSQISDSVDVLREFWDATIKKLEPFAEKLEKDLNAAAEKSTD